MSTENITIKQAEFTEGLRIVIMQYNRNSDIRHPITHLSRDSAFALIRTMEAAAEIFDYTSFGEILADILETFRYSYFQTGTDEAEWFDKEGNEVAQVTDQPDYVRLHRRSVANKFYGIEFLLKRLSTMNDEYERFKSASTTEK